MLVEFECLKGIIRGVWRGIWKRWNFVLVFLSRWIIWLKLLYHVIQKAWIFNRYYVVGYSMEFDIIYLLKIDILTEYVKWNKIKFSKKNQN